MYRKLSVKSSLARASIDFAGRLFEKFRGSNPLKILRKTTAPAWDRSPRPPRSCKSQYPRRSLTTTNTSPPAKLVRRNLFL